MRHDIAARTRERVYVLPHLALRSVIPHYTIFRPCARSDGKGGGRLQLLPDASGCIVCGIGSSGIDLRYWGPTSKTVSVDNGIGTPPAMIFVEFLPGGAGRLFRMPMRQWQDRNVPLDCADSELHRNISAALSPDYDAFLHALNRIFSVTFPAGDF